MISLTFTSRLRLQDNSREGTLEVTMTCLLLRGVLALLREKIVFREHLQSTKPLCFVLSHTLSLTPVN